MVDYQSYQHTQQLVRKILEQPAAQGLAPEVQELVESIRNVLQSDQEHMEEAVRCASYIEQVGIDIDNDFICYSAVILCFLCLLFIFIPICFYSTQTSVTQTEHLDS